MDIRDLAVRAAADPIARHDVGPVLVAVDGTRAGWDALAWAAAEADARATDLRIVHAFAPPVTTDPFGHASYGMLAEASASAADRVIDEAVGRTRATSPSMPVSTSIIAGASTTSVSEAGRDAALVVVGRHHRPGPLLPWASPTSWRIARHTEAPVVIVDGDDRGRHGPSSGRIVACLGGHVDPMAVMGFALRAAVRWGVGVTALHLSPTDASPAEASGYFAEPRVDDALRASQDAFPQVSIRHRAIAAELAIGLLAESVATALVVVGRSPRRASRSVVRRTLCGAARGAVAVVGPMRA